MPRYDFECPTHGIMEVEHAFGVEHPKSCPVEGCREELTRVLLAHPTIIYGAAGGGWTGALGNGPGRWKTKVESPEANTPYD